MARSAVDRLTAAFLELSPAGLLAAIVNVDTAIKAAAANVFAKVFIISLCYIFSVPNCISLSSTNSNPDALLKQLLIQK
ncbi:hypothetical protein D3C87_1861170 [compost metagenome]